VSESKQQSETNVVINDKSCDVAAHLSCNGIFKTHLLIIY